MFEYVPEHVCWERTGRAPVSTKWVETEKVDDEGEQMVRCRLVGRDFKPKGEKDREDLFAAMPPLEAKRLLFRMMAAEEENEDSYERGEADVRRRPESTPGAKVRS